jgi:hypothetical protein
MSEWRESWAEANQRLLVEELARVRALVEGRPREASASASDQAAAPALEVVRRAFGLSPFERDVLLLCAGVELEPAFAEACAAAQGEPGRPYPSFGLAFATIPGSHWSALSPAAPLRRWRLLEIGAEDLITNAPLRIDEAVLHFLTGLRFLDERLDGVVQPVPEPADLPPSHEVLAVRLAELLSRGNAGRLPLAHLGGRNPSAGRAVAAAAAARARLGLWSIRAADVPAPASERARLGRIWKRQALLGPGALLIEWEDHDGPEVVGRGLALAEQLGSAVVLAGCEAPSAARPLIRLDVTPLTPDEQRELWLSAPLNLNGALNRVVGQFDLSGEEIRAAGAEARAREASGAPPAEALWDACRAQARPRLDDLAQRIEPTAGWDDLVVAEPERRTLRELVMHVRHRTQVHERWGFAAKGARGLGVSALFAGPSGTGKTMAAEVLARELRLDLYRIDLSAVVSKYIGETEKNLRRVFDAAEQGGAILLFDEADALFGKRSEVKDSHDRYANIEVGYLLQRMEAYRGLAILTTNLKSALDPSFLRRLRFVVQFPRPDAAARREIWLRTFPDRTPRDGVDVDVLARLDLTGGSIRNVALRAAFLAADAGVPVGMTHLANAARSECAKLERAVSGAELKRWT